MTLFRLDASIRTEGSRSRALGDLVEEAWRSAAPGDAVVRRHLGTDPLPSTLWADAVTAGFVPEGDRTEAQRDAAATATRLVDEMVEADALLFAVPLYNFGVSQHFKTWVDVALTEARLGPAATSSVLKGKPAVLATVRGGAYGAGTPREGWDHATPWMRRILEDNWELDLRVVEQEFTLVGVNPALDEFKDLAAQMRADAEEVARRHGRDLAEALRVAA